jgi:hypothetical protein
MLKCIDPASNLTKLAEQAMSMRRVHPTSLLQYYTAESADIVSRLYPQDFEILGYPLWDGGN